MDLEHHLLCCGYGILVSPFQTPPDAASLSLHRCDLQGSPHHDRARSSLARYLQQFNLCLRRLRSRFRHRAPGRHPHGLVQTRAQRHRTMDPIHP